jgi:hypothetical protein
MKTPFSTRRSFLAPLVIALLAQGAFAQVYASRHDGGYRSHATSRVWVPGRYETVHERLWVPGRTERVWVEPSFEWRIGPCGSRLRIQVSAGGWRNHHPGHYERRAVQVWRPGHWASRPCR